MLAWTCGCSPKRQPGIYVTEGSNLYVRDMKPGDVIFRINGESVTKRDYDHLHNLRDILFRMRKGIYICGRNPEAERYMIADEQRVLDVLENCTLVRQAVDSAGTHVDEETVNARWEGFARQIKRSGKSMEDVRAEIGGELGDYFRDWFHAGVRQDAYLHVVLSNAFAEVSETDISNRMAWVENFNANADRNNRANEEMLKRVRKEILGGLSFAEAAKKYSEVKPGDGKEWSTVQLGELPDGRDGEKNKLRLWLEKAKVGDISDPLEMDDGISIVGLADKWHLEETDGGKGPACFKLVRCTRYFREHSDYQNHDATAKQIQKWRQEDGWKELSERLYREAVLEFPHGTNFFPDASESWEWWQEKFNKRR